MALAATQKVQDSGLPSGVYEIVNVLNGKMYIGSLYCLRLRFKAHMATLRADNHRNVHLQRAWNKCGAEAFVFSIIEYVSEKSLIEREQFWIDAYCAATEGYNIAPTAGNCLGIKRSDDFCRKMSEARKGKPAPSGAFKHGHVMPEETKKKISKTLKGKKATSETIENMSAAQKKAWKKRERPVGEKNPMFGKKHTEEAKRKMKESRRRKTKYEIPEFKAKPIPE